jgi:hypothetical protein
MVKTPGKLVECFNLSIYVRVTIALDSQCFENRALLGPHL